MSGQLGRQEVAHAYAERGRDLLERRQRRRLLKVQQPTEVRSADAGMVGEPILFPAAPLHALTDGLRDLAVELRRRRHLPNDMDFAGETVPYKAIPYSATEPRQRPLDGGVG
jgi:hypothetical protein